jgi:hypothetical protein
VSISRTVLGPLLLFVVVGCDAPRGRVHGVIKWNGQPLAGAIVTFFDSTNATRTADTGADGAYAIDGIVHGTVRVSVQIPPPRPRPRPDPGPGKAGNNFGREQARAEDAAKFGRLPDPPPPTAAPPAPGGLPARYGDPKTSELSFDLKSVDQEYSVDLK